MTRPSDAVRSAVLRALRAVGDPGCDPLALVACSGGADSLALAAASGMAARSAGWRVGAVIVDHGLQPGSHQVAADAARQCRGLLLDPVLVVRADAAAIMGRGPEGAARQARYEALAGAARAERARAMLLAHTRDDQAETVLLGLARGSGAHSLRGMAAAAPLLGAPGTVLLRPLLGLSRATLAGACAAWGLQPWQDPHNADPAYARSRVRHRALPALVDALGPAVAASLARTADLLRDDDDALTGLAETALAELGDPAQCRGIAGHHRAVRRRILRRLALRAGCPAADLTAVHLYALDALVASGRDGGDVRLPGGVHAAVRCGRLVLAGASDISARE